MINKIDKLKILLRRRAIQCCGPEGELGFSLGYLFQLLKDLDEKKTSIDHTIEYLANQLLESEYRNKKLRGVA